MKKLFTLLFLATSMICFGQNKNFLKAVSYTHLTLPTNSLV